MRNPGVADRNSERMYRPSVRQRSLRPTPSSDDDGLMRRARIYRNGPQNGHGSKRPLAKTYNNGNFNNNNNNTNNDNKANV